MRQIRRGEYVETTQQANSVQLLDEAQPRHFLLQNVRMDKSMHTKSEDWQWSSCWCTRKIRCGDQHS